MFLEDPSEKLAFAKYSIGDHNSHHSKVADIIPEWQVQGRSMAS